MSNPHTAPVHRILVIDDNPSIHEDIRKILQPTTGAAASLSAAKSRLFDEETPDHALQEFAIDSALQGEEGIRMVDEAAREGRPYSLAFVDVRMPPGLDGIETITRIWRKHPGLQTVVCTAYSDYSWEDMVRKLGPTSSMVVLKKPFDNIEVLQLAHALTEKWRLMREAEDRIRDLDARVISSEERFSKAFDSNPIPLAMISLADETISECNPGFQELTGLSAAEINGHTLGSLGLLVDPDHCREVIKRVLAGEQVRQATCQLRAKGDGIRDVLISAEPIDFANGRFLLATFEDVTEHLLLEKQLRHSQKLEAVGQLAAGIAHDFNNMLTVIQGNASLILSDAPSDADRPMLEGILRSGQRAAKLVRQLLTFSHKQMMEVRALNLAQMFAALSEMLPRMLGEMVTVRIEADRNLPLVHADPSMIEQMLLNLAVNARDAMPRGGQLNILASVTKLDATILRTNQDARPGRFVCLEVSDTGSGIPPDVLPRIFEPFFTTKPVGKGTGLGLATAYGIAKQHNGWIDVRSDVGVGSTFRAYLPLDESIDPPAESTAPAGLSSCRGGSETILVVEDEEAVRSCVEAILTASGYRVVTANNGVEALATWDKHSDEVSLLLTDMVMPEGVNGIDLATRLVSEKPDLKVIYSSGYSDDLTASEMQLPKGQRFLGKPYQSQVLIELVREVLDETHTSAFAAD